MRCPRCALRACLCADVVQLPTRTQIVILRHRLERHKRSNSARWAALALPACRIVDYGGRDEENDLPSLLGPGTWLVYPDGQADCQADGQPSVRATPSADAAGPAGPAQLARGPRPETLLFVDGSWTQTRRMVQRIPGLVSLPRLSLLPGPERPRLRRPQAGGLATLEAIAAALALVEGPELAARLDALYVRAVQLSCAMPEVAARHRPGGPRPHG